MFSLELIIASQTVYRYQVIYLPRNIFHSTNDSLILECPLQLSEGLIIYFQCFLKHLDPFISLPTCDGGCNIRVTLMMHPGSTGGSLRGADFISPWFQSRERRCRYPLPVTEAAEWLTLFNIHIFNCTICGLKERYGYSSKLIIFQVSDQKVRPLATTHESVKTKFIKGNMPEIWEWTCVLPTEQDDHIHFLFCMPFNESV